MANTISMDSLKKEAIHVYTGMIVVFPQFSTEGTLSISNLSEKFNNCYATNNSTVCFVSDHEIFVTPSTRATISALDSAGFSKKDFYVPFSNCDYPKDEQAKWNKLQEKARQTYKADFITDCEAYCDKNNIGSISKESLANCFEMPDSGVTVQHFFYSKCYYPILNSTCFDGIAAMQIGHFCFHNGIVVFVYRNGKTYVSKGYKVLGELYGAGYIQSNLFVPFSNGEKILDYNLRARWESIR